jgi:beta-glucosidase
MTGIMRGEWGNQGMSITDNVLVNYCNGVDGILAGGVTTFDAMLWYVVQQLPKYEKDPVIVQAMKDACHHNLYALANSSGMNGIGPKTKVKAITPGIVIAAVVIAVVVTLACGFFVFMWIRGSRKLKKTEEYAAYKQAKLEKKLQKKAQKELDDTPETE